MEVYITQKDWDKIINYARCSSQTWGTEIGGMAVTLQDKDGDWKIQDPVIMKQEVSQALCELDKTELAQYYSKMAMKYKNHNMRFCWWHSHAEMSAFWSGTDKNTIDEYEDGDLSFALVVNCKEEYKCRVSVWKPFVMHEDIELTIQGTDSVKYRIPKAVQTEVEKHCTKPKPSYYNSGSSYMANMQGRLFGESAVSKERMMISKSWVDLIDKVDEINSAFIAGEFQYDKYADKINDLNRRIKNAKLPLQVELISQGSFDDLLSIQPSELISCEVGYEDLDPSDAYDIDMIGWNESFGVRGINGKN